MREYVAYQNDGLGNQKFLQANGVFTYDESTAVRYKGRFWIELLKVLLQLIITFGINTKLKRVM